MKILGVETSCDETAVAVVQDGRRILANRVASQDALHSRFGGIVPELASRAHVTALPALLDGALSDAGCVLADMDAIAVTNRPGLIGALLVGVEWAKGLAYALDIPLVGVNHLEGHLVAISLEEPAPSDVEGDPPGYYPQLGLVVSGGHTALYEVTGFGQYSLIAQTLDDAAGEALDKIAAKLGLGYPGGRPLEELAQSGDGEAYTFPRVRVKRGPAFSYSGLKTAAARYIREAGETLNLPDFAASFQNAVVRELVAQTVAAVKKRGVSTVVLGGGVAANGYLRSRLSDALAEVGGTLRVPSRHLCTDNGAMIAAAGYMRLQSEAPAPLTLTATARGPL